MNNASRLIGKTVRTADSEIGSVDDIYFDDQWNVRYLVVDTGKWLAGQKARLAPEAIVKPWHHEAVIAVNLPTEQVRSLSATAEGEPAEGRSANEMGGYRVQATDGEVGTVSDLLLDDELSRILFLAVDVKGWFFGKTVLVGPSLVSRVDGQNSAVHVDTTRQALKSAQEYNPAA